MCVPQCMLVVPPLPMRLCCRRAAPEIISNLHIEDATKIDIWSAGVMLYVMLFCCYPFERPDDNANQGDQQKYQKARTEAPVGGICDHGAERHPFRCLLWADTPVHKIHDVRAC